MFRVRASAVRLLGIVMLSSMSTESTSPEYHYYNQTLSWSDAQSFCRDKHSDLATVTSMEEAQLLSQTAAGRGDAWIGLRNDGPARWLWSNGNGALSSSYWLAGEPSYSECSTDCCAEVTASGWNDLKCTRVGHLVCRGKTSPYYFLQPHTWGWRDALDHCRSLDMDLPAVGSNPTVINAEGITSFWSGLFQDRWAWSDESPTSLRYWMVGRPANLQGCAVVSVTDQGRWYEEQCEAEMPFVCQGGLKSRRVLIKLKIESHGDLDRSATSAQLLQQLEAQLRSQGISDFKLSWKSDIRRQDEINENPAAESHGPGSEELKLDVD
ncbi:macrophage mannose receptor 1-like [Gadus chalcogrammus]|uniref:macrophage mannose receptor 1-like n=1 Tax=Gadus chalcogrammus TaxID=1042646 RepID=UPI0024C4B911|nr:macrophage mannose receptor 1-like [Gadus chalcogrammus]